MVSYRVISHLPSSTIGPCRAVLGVRFASKPQVAGTTLSSVQPELGPQQRVRWRLQSGYKRR